MVSLSLPTIDLISMVPGKVERSILHLLHFHQLSTPGGVGVGGAGTSGGGSVLVLVGGCQCEGEDSKKWKEGGQRLHFAPFTICSVYSM